MAGVGGARKGEGETVWLGGIGVIYRLPASATDGAFSVIEHVIRPGTLTPPHLHTREHEFSYVLEGMLGAQIGEKILRVGPGEFAVKPKGVVHAFWNEGPGPLRFLELISPAGLENFFQEAARHLSRPGGPDEAAMEALSAKYGLQNFFEKAPAIMKQFRVSLFGQPPRG